MYGVIEKLQMVNAKEDLTQPPVHLAVLVETDAAGAGEKARSLAAQLRTTLLDRDSSLSAAEFLLVFTGERVELRERRSGTGPIYVDFSTVDVKPDGRNLSRRQPLARAMGKKVRTIIDATAGFGHDAFLLAAMGYEVLAIERSPAVAALLEDGMARAAKDPELQRALNDRLKLLVGDAKIILASGTVRADVVYIDPMFPPKRKASALAKKEMRALRALVGEDTDAAGLLAVARGCARNRVVIKRPLYAPPLIPDPAFSQAGKLVRYDVYLRRL